MPTSVPALSQEAHVELGHGTLHCSASQLGWLKQLELPGLLKLQGDGGQLWTSCRERTGL